MKEIIWADIRVFILDKNGNKLNSWNELLEVYGVRGVRNQWCRPENLTLKRRTSIKIQCRECLKIKEVKVNSRNHFKRMGCKSCSKRGSKNYFFCNPIGKGKKKPKEYVDKIVATRRLRDNYKHSEKTKNLWRQTRKGENNANFGKKWTEQKKQKLAEKICKLYTSGHYNKFRKQNTNPEKKFASLLLNNKIEYKPSKVIATKVFDFFIPKLNMLIEVDGTYWHGKNKEFAQLNETQKRNRINDELKNKIAAENGFILLRIWEDEIDFKFPEIIRQYKEV